MGFHDEGGAQWSQGGDSSSLESYHTILSFVPKSGASFDQVSPDHGSHIFVSSVNCWATTRELVAHIQNPLLAQVLFYVARQLKSIESSDGMSSLAPGPPIWELRRCPPSSKTRRQFDRSNEVQWMCTATNSRCNLKQVPKQVYRIALHHLW